MADPSTEQRLIAAAIDLFGRDGKGAVGTRAIAEAAHVQLSAISYHFQSKDGLYLACARTIASTMQAKTMPLIAQSHRTWQTVGAPEAIQQIVDGMLLIMLREDIAPIARFVVREQMNPTDAFVVLYEGAMRDLVELLAELVQVVAGERLSSEEATLRAFALLGQVFAFRFGQATLMRSTGWKRIGPRETEKARATVAANVRAILGSLRLSEAA